MVKFIVACIIIFCVISSFFLYLLCVASGRYERRAEYEQAKKLYMEKLQEKEKEED
jgi:hypothetical protein